jgi:hypothetical protein
MFRAPGSIPRLLFHILTILRQRRKLCSKILFHFLTRFPQREKTMVVTSVSFFNKISTEKKTMLKASVSFFNELATEKRNFAHGFFLIMASKRIKLWKETTSREKSRSWIPRDLHWMEENYSGRNTCRGFRKG